MLQPMHKQILEPHPHSSTSHQINFTSIVFWPPRPVGAGGPLFYVAMISKDYHDGSWAPKKMTISHQNPLGEVETEGACVP